MPTITVVTGNKHKLEELQRLFPKDYKLDVAELDLPEIQSADVREIVTDKVKRAYKILKKPVVVDDVTAGLDQFNGLPGPFIKYFEAGLGKGALYKLAGNKEARATVSTIVAFYNGQNLIFGRGEVHGKVISPTDGQGFGFDFVFVPDGQTKTFAQMGPLQKDKVSHRGLAVKDLLKQMDDL